YSVQGNIVYDTTSASAFQRASAWLVDCLTNHDCVVPDPDYLPRRVLDVSPLSWDDEDRIRLVEESPEVGPYAALSYCWVSGLTGMVQTSKANKIMHCQGITLQSLPKTIRDAVLVCRGLGLRHLWVDALCIVQDDPEDWRREAVNMAAVYSNSQVTIAAHAAASCKDRFLGEQEYGQPSWQQEFWTEFGPLARNKMYVRTNHPERLPPSPLATRGWTLQEAVLPHRTLHYTGKELVWECDVKHFCE
ncbi:heterokaryon incompatibility protein-domain-containing protein, partial [Xylogone sp. PMI_703]